MPRLRTSSGGHTRSAETRTRSRFKVPSIKDARWIVGALLLLGGFFGTLRVISGMDDSTVVWSARHSLLPGQHVTASDLRKTRVKLNSESRAYFAVAKAPAGTIERPISAGELLPRSAVGEAADVNTREIAVTLDRSQADVVHSGTDAEVWVARKNGTGGNDSYTKPEPVVDRAFVARVGSRSDGVVSVSDASAVQLFVPKDKLADLIDAVNSGARITLVPAAGEGQ